MEKINFINNQAPALNATNLNQLQTNIENEFTDSNDFKNLYSNNYLEFSYNLNKLLNEKVKGISELYSEDIDYIKLYIGSSNTSMYKIRNSLELVSLILKEEIK